MTGIITALAKVQAGIHAVGVGKVRRNQEQKFNFRGIDDALNAFAPLLTEHGVVVMPSYSDIHVTERATKSGGITFNVRLAGTFRFVAVADGSEVIVGPFYGEANDGQDKAISKATSVAYRNALFLTFCVPHEPAIGGDPDGHGEEPDDKSAVIAGEWVQAVRDAGSLDDLAKVRAECIAAYGMADKVPAAIKAAFRTRTAELSP